MRYKIGDNFVCLKRKCKHKFKIDKYFFCPKCLKSVPLNLDDDLNHVYPLLKKFIQICQTKSTEFTNNSDNEKRFYDVFVIILSQFVINRTIQNKYMGNLSVNEYRSKILQDTGIDLHLSFDNMSKYLENVLAFYTLTFHSECIFVMDTYFRKINQKYELISDSNHSAKLLKAIYDKINEPFDPVKNPIRALFEIRNTYHDGNVSKHNQCFKIDRCLFKLRKNVKHNYSTMSHIVFLLERCFPILEKITLSINK